MITIKNRKTDEIFPCDYPVHRGFPLGNPFSHLPKSKAEFYSPTKEDSIISFKNYLKAEINTGNPVICDAINELIIRNLKKQDFALVCYCSPKSCHAEIIRDFVLEQPYCINWFSNMKKMDQPFFYQGIRFDYVENFYQSMKLPKADLENRKYIASLNPYKAKTEIRKFQIDNSFQERKLEVMEYALRKKFAEGTSWNKKLINYQKELIEWTSWGDKFWGIDVFSGQGQNNLGKLLSKIRNEYNNK